MKDKRVNISDWIIYIGMICIFVVFPHFSSSRVSKNVSFFVPDTKQKSDSPVSCRL